MMLTIKWAGGYSTPGQAVTERHRLDGQRRERLSVYIRKCSAGVAELADAVALGATGFTALGGQIPPPAPDLQAASWPGEKFSLRNRLQEFSFPNFAESRLNKRTETTH